MEEEEEVEEEEEEEEERAAAWTSSREVVACWETPIIMPSCWAARAEAFSPSGCIRQWTPVLRRRWMGGWVGG